MKKQFLLKLLPPRSTFVEDMSETERTIMNEHIEYWRDLTDKGIAVVFGPVLDPKSPWGLGIVEVDDENLAHAIAANDPSVKSGLNKVEIYTMRIGMVRK